MSSESSFVQKGIADAVVMQAFSGIMAHRRFPFYFTATANFTEV
jgi:hypothetical protein